MYHWYFLRIIYNAAFKLESFFKLFCFPCFYKSLTPHSREDAFKAVSPSKWYLLVPTCETFVGCYFPSLNSKLTHGHLHQTANPLAQLMLFNLTAGTVRLASHLRPLVTAPAWVPEGCNTFVCIPKSIIATYTLWTDTGHLEKYVNTGFKAKISI